MKDISICWNIFVILKDNALLLIRYIYNRIALLTLFDTQETRNAWIEARSRSTMLKDYNKPKIFILYIVNTFSENLNFWNLLCRVQTVAVSVTCNATDERYQADFYSSCSKFNIFTIFKCPAIFDQYILAQSIILAKYKSFFHINIFFYFH